MINILVFSLGLLVTGMTATAAFFVGLQEAGNPSSSNPEDLNRLEKKLVDRDDIPGAANKPTPVNPSSTAS